MRLLSKIYLTGSYSLDKTRLPVYQGKALNVPTAPQSISSSLWEKKIFWKLLILNLKDEVWNFESNEINTLD